MATLHNPVWGLDVCGETSPAFITWLGEVNLSGGSRPGSRVGTQSIQSVKGMEGGCKAGVWIGWGEGGKGPRAEELQFCKNWTF